MANTRTSAKRARQAMKRQTLNRSIRSATHSALKGAIDSVKGKDVAQTKTAYETAVRALSKAASKGSIPKGRAARKISRLTLLLKKSLPAALPTSGRK